MTQLSKGILILLLSFLFTGCATFESLENRVVCTVSNDEAFMVSKYGPIGISSQISDKDKDAICFGSQLFNMYNNNGPKK